MKALTLDGPTLRVGIAGLGIAGAALLPALGRNPNVKIGGAFTRDSKRLKKFAEEFSANVFSSFEALCASKEIDAIYIATPTEWHTHHVIQAAEHGKHIIVEKPLAVTLEDADSMIRAAESNGVVLIVGHSHSFEPPIQKMREIVKSGVLGPVKMIHNWYFNDWMYRPRTPEELDTTKGGGVTFRQGAHQFDIIRFIGGGLVRSVRAVTGVWDLDRPTEGAHTVFLEFEDGTVATAVYNGYDHFHTTELTFSIGEGGPARISQEYGKSRKKVKQYQDPAMETQWKRELGYAGARDHVGSREFHHAFFGLTLVSCERGDIRQSPKGLWVYGEESKQEVELPVTETGRDVLLRELYDAVRLGREPVHDGRWGKANLEVCLAVLQSARERREVFLKHQVPVRD